MYEPKTGRNAGKKNREYIEEYISENPDSNGVEISEYTGLSLKTVYSHLAILRKEHADQKE